MDAFKAQFERIKQQLSALTVTQKMLVAALVAVMVLTMLYWGRYAGDAEMVSVLGDQALTQEDIGPIIQQLDLMGIPYKADVGKVLVPTERKSEILASLMFNRALPSDTHSAFETMSKSLNPFSPDSDRQAAYTQATAMELSELISRFPGVSYAHVVINAKIISRIEGGIPPSATVIVNTRGEADHVKQLVRACADGVAHAVSGLSPGQISVIINGASMKVPDDASGVSNSSDLADLRKEREAELEQNIRKAFPFIEGLTVSVNCDIDNRDVKTNSTAFDKKTSGVLPKQVDSKTTETSSQAAGSHEPGVSSNTSGTNGPISLDANGGAAASSPPNTSNIQDDKTTNEVFPGQLVTDTHTPAGKDTVQSATVRVPLSYFAAVFKRIHPKAADPSDADMDTFNTAQLATIREGVKNVIGLKSESDLSVDSYADMPPSDLAMAAGPSSPVALSTVSGHAREIGVGVLAVISLLMMATMVRKSTPAPMIISAGGVQSGSTSAAAAAAVAKLNSLSSGESLAGEVSAGSATLDGMEMDEDSVRTQQMLDQVSTMVKENPDGAAALVKRWLSRV